MKLIAVTTVLEEPTLPRTIQYLYDQGVDQIIVSAEDEPTGDLAYQMDAVVYRTQQPFDQGSEITRLAQRAATFGASWIIPFDADEYWCNLNTLDQVDKDVDTIYAPMYLHITPELRAIQPKPLPKVLFRPREDMTVSWGSHDVTGVRHLAQTSIHLSEWQYESFDHFLAKIDKARRLHAQPHMNPANGSHMVRLIDMTPAELAVEWVNHLKIPTVYDPIPGSDQWT